MTNEEAAPEAPAQQETREVACRGSEPHESDKRDELDLSSGGHHPAHDDSRLARHRETDKRAGLEKREARDRGVGPTPEGVRGVFERATEVRQRYRPEHHQQRARRPGQRRPEDEGVLKSLGAGQFHRSLSV